MTLFLGVHIKKDPTFFWSPHQITPFFQRNLTPNAPYFHSLVGTCMSLSYSSDTPLAYRLCQEKLKFQTIFLKFKRAISRTTASILGLFVLILMHFLWWIQMWQWKFELRKFLKKLGNFDLSSALDTRRERVNILAL